MKLTGLIIGLSAASIHISSMILSAQMNHMSYTDDYLPLMIALVISYGSAGYGLGKITADSIERLRQIFRPENRNKEEKE